MILFISRIDSSWKGIACMFALIIVTSVFLFIREGIAKAKESKDEKIGREEEDEIYQEYINNSFKL